ncbi:MAG: nucleotidyl transferase AbiEii/AbiGii toxin family protein [Nanoarchaeota archaeon]
MTPKLPLNLRLKKRHHKELAYAQDILMEDIYVFFPNAILHGGTAIWRCYRGNRFSEDIDMYIVKDNQKITDFFESLEKKGFKIIKKRVKENSLYAEIMISDVPVRFEATFQSKKSTLKKYETSESFFINVFTLSPNELIIEKINAYLKRLKIRDLYDIFFLLSYIKRESNVVDHLKRLINNFKKPVDESNLAAIIFAGVAPNSGQLLENIRKWVR